MQHSFDWRGVAAGAIAGGVFAEVGNAIGQAQYGEQGWAKLNGLAQDAKDAALWSYIGKTMARGAASGVAAGMASGLVRGGSLRNSFPGIIQDVIASTVGNAIGLGAQVTGQMAQTSANSDDDQGPKVYRNGSTLRDQELFGGEKNWLNKMGLSDYTATNTSNRIGSWSDTVAQWREENPGYRQQVHVQGKKTSVEQYLAERFPGSDATSLNSTEQSRNFNQRYYNANEASASHPAIAAFWHVAGLTSDAAHNLEGAGRGIVSLFTDPQALTTALNGLQQTWNQLPTVVINGMQNFSQLSYGKQAESLYKFGLENVATFGAGKIVATTGGLAYQGGVSSVKWLAPKAGEWLTIYAQRTGLVLNAVEDTGVPTLNGANTSVDLAAQAGGTGRLRFPRTEGLGTHSTMADLRATGALPGEQGVIITDRTVRFGDVYELGTLGGRQVEFSLVTEYAEGSLVKKLYSGDAWTSPVPRDSRLLGHVHPNENAFQLWPSTQDMNMVNARYFRELMVNPNATPAPTRIFWGPGNTDNTIFHPGFGKNPLTGKGG